MTTDKVRKTARIRNRYNQVTHLSQDKMVKSNKIKINITNNSQELRGQEMQRTDILTTAKTHQPMSPRQEVQHTDILTTAKTHQPMSPGQEVQHTDSHTTALPRQHMATQARDAAHRQSHDSKNTPNHGIVGKRCSTQTVTRQREHTNLRHRGQEMQHTDSHTTARTHQTTAFWARDAAHGESHDSKNTPNHGIVGKRCSTPAVTRQREHTNPWHRGQEMQHTESHTIARTHQTTALRANDAAHRQSHDSKNTPTHGTVGKRCITLTVTRQREHTKPRHRGQDMQHTDNHTIAITHRPMAPWARYAAH